MKNQKIKLSIILMLCIGLATVEAQVAIITLGGNASSNSGSVSYTVGQLLFNTNYVSNGSITNGIQLPFEIYNVLGLKEFRGKSMNLYVYPNPTTDFFILKVDNDFNNELSYQIFDTSGRLLSNKKVLVNETKIEVRDFVTATYFLKIYQKNREIKTIKIIKKQKG
ncbi:T9SS type A sorting domain-containing protein [Mariniflexile gromovii]|uniref:T9SS type A sorting domain-containing protein n=1 Tax=Mariniflexile gromovii TaxID=362523 RepID=A0ABS4BTU5_9FLAO|nr:T9SS type A sorting domain-containing protein [Mariniflexile gromovii]MBP0903490.1 T9SS type A sorting domain-containing protein [Mariniflexile gromovii]